MLNQCREIQVEILVSVKKLTKFIQLKNNNSVAKGLMTLKLNRGFGDRSVTYPGLDISFGYKIGIILGSTI